MLKTSLINFGTGRLSCFCVEDGYGVLKLFTRVIDASVRVNVFRVSACL